MVNRKALIIIPIPTENKTQEGNNIKYTEQR